MTLFSDRYGPDGPPMSLAVHVFATCDGETAAEHLSKQLHQALSAWNPVLSATPQRYWKMPELYSFLFRLGPGTEEAFNAIVGLVPERWHSSNAYGERSSVWNPSAGSVFLLPEVTWAEVQFYLVNQNPQ